MKLLLPLVTLLAAPAAEARYSDACFSREEVSKMYAKRDVVSKAAAECLKNYWDTHQKFFQKFGYSKYYGNRNKHLDNPDKRAKYLAYVLNPDLFPSDLVRKFDQAWNLTAAVDTRDGAKMRSGLADMEKWLARTNPGVYREFMARKPGQKLLEKAADERGAERGQVDLRGNVSQLEQNISCVDMTRRCLQHGFKAAGMGDTFKKIDNEVLANDVSGTEMQKALSDLGWRTLYFNPDPSQNAAFDAEDKCINPLPNPNPPPCAAGVPPENCPKKKVWMGSWGGHVDGWSLYCDNGRLRPGKKTGGVSCSDEYALGAERPIPIDDKRLLVGFRTTIPAEFKNVPFFVGTGHGGYHVFPGFYGNVIEAHSMRALQSENNLEVSTFNPLDQANPLSEQCQQQLGVRANTVDNHGGPRWTDQEHYRSGVIVVPPGYLDNGFRADAAIVDDRGCVDLKPRKQR